MSAVLRAAMRRWFRGQATDQDVALLLAEKCIRPNAYTARAGVVSYLATAKGQRL